MNLPLPRYNKPSPLDIAVLKDDVRLVGFLLAKGADPNLKHGCFGSALHIACCCGQVARPGRFAIVEQLLRHGADPNAFRRAEPGTSGVEEIDDNGRNGTAVVGLKSPLVEFLRCTDARLVNGVNCKQFNEFYIICNFSLFLGLFLYFSDSRCEDFSFAPQLWRPNLAAPSANRFSWPIAKPFLPNGYFHKFRIEPSRSRATAISRLFGPFNALHC